MAEAKGTTMVGLVKWLRKRREEASAILQENQRRYLQPATRVMPGAWYPEEDLAEFLRAMARLRPEPEPEVYRLMGGDAAREHLGRVYRHLLKLPDIRQGMGTLWESQHTTGQISVIEEDPHGFCYEMTDYAHPTRAMCELLVGYYQALLEAGGYGGVTVAELECRLEGAERCLWRCKWAVKPE